MFFVTEHKDYLILLVTLPITDASHMTFTHDAQQLMSKLNQQA